MLKPSDNIVHRLLRREISSRPSGCQLHKVRRLYENIVPNHTVYDVECPDYIFRKFTNDGQYLIAFSRNSQHLVVYRFNWMTYCVRGDEPQEEMPPKSKKFESFFTQLHFFQLAFGSETICKDFFLTTEDGAYGVFATSTRHDTESSSTDGAVPGVPSIERIKILIVRLADGVITDDRVYHDDFIHLSHNMGVFMYEDLLAVLSVRYQCIHILQIRVTTGTFVDVRKIGDFCQEDDELLINSQAQREALFQSKQAVLRKGKDSITEKLMPHVEEHFESGDHVSHFPVSGETSGDIHSTTAETRNLVVAGATSPAALRISSANSQTGTSRYVITSRQAVEESSIATGSLLLPNSAQVQTPVSSSGSRSMLELHSSSTGAEVTTGNVTSTAVTTSSSRNELVAQSILPRPVPLANRLPPRIMDSARSFHEGGSEQEQHQIDAPSGRVLGGIKQRLLSFIFRSTLDHDGSSVLSSQRLKRFYYHFQHYLELVMWKVQFLDRHHLLIKFGSVDGVASRSCDAPQQPAFFVVYNFETTEILEFQQNSSEEFLHLFENFADHFRASQRYPVFMNYVTSCANNIFVREQMREQKVACLGNKTNSKSNSYMQIARRTLASIPFNSQSQSPSVYFDHSLFHFDEKLISATDRLKPSMEHPIKFLSRRRPHILKFKINPGPEHGGNDNRVKRVAAFLFHPIFPFAISVQQSFVQVVNFHLKR